jgi:hypothetical protein
METAAIERNFQQNVKKNGYSRLIQKTVTHGKSKASLFFIHKPCHTAHSYELPRPIYLTNVAKLQRGYLGT